MSIQIPKIIVLSAMLALASCSKKNDSIYQELGPDQDGTVAVEVPKTGEEPPPKLDKSESKKDVLADPEKQLVEELHDSEFDKLSFMVVDVESKQIIKSYFAERAQRLASVSKIPTALGALENVRNVEVPKVAGMLKISNNGEASRYVRLSAKAIDDYNTPGKPYTQKHSCPDAFLQEEVAADIVLQWLHEELPNVNWTQASLNDGAGCHYDNFMTSIQVAKILEYADQRGAIYDGKTFEELLSINGVDGTWKNKNLDTVGAIFAKTGTLMPNANLSGYFYAKRGDVFRKHYFTVFVNKKGGGEYSTRARKLIEGLLRYWIDYYSNYPGDPLQSF